MGREVDPYIAAVRNDRLKAEMARLKVSQAELARRVQRTPAQINHWFSGRNPMDSDSARLLERGLSLDAGALDADEPGSPASKNWSNRPHAVRLEGNPEFPAIPKVRFKLSAGATGFAVEHVEDGSDPIVFRREWFESRGYRPEKLFAVAVTNGSMEPTLFAGDLVVVNTEDASLKDGAVVAANFEGEPVVKRLQRDEGQWWLASDNPDKRRYPRKLCTTDVKIIGRVVHKQSETI